MPEKIIVKYTIRYDKNQAFLSTKVAFLFPNERRPHDTAEPMAGFLPFILQLNATLAARLLSFSISASGIPCKNRLFFNKRFTFYKAIFRMLFIVFAATDCYHYNFIDINQQVAEADFM